MKTINQILVIIFLLTSYAFVQGPQWRVYRTNNSGLPSNYINCVAIDSNNVKWIGTDNGLVKLENNVMSVYDTSNSDLPQNFIKRIAIDLKNNLWIGTLDKGLVKYNGVNCQIFDTLNSGITSNRINDIQIAQDVKWIGTFNRGLVKYDNLNFTTFNTTNSGISSNLIGSIKLENNIKWLGSYALYGGLTRLSDTGVVIYRDTNSGIPTNVVTSIDSDYLNNLWISTYFGGGLAKFNYISNTWIIYNRSNSGLPDNNLLTVTTQKNVKWIGTLGAGLAKFDDTSWVVFNPDNSPIPSITILKITLDRYGNTWIATDGGLAVYNQNGIVSVENQEQIIPISFILYQNYPNPFNPTTSINYSITSNINHKASFVKLSIFDIIGKELSILVSEKKEAGNYEVEFDGTLLPSCILFYRIEVDGYSETKKMLLIK